MKVFHGLSEVAGQGSITVKGLVENNVDTDMIVWRKHPMVYPFDYSLDIDPKKIYMGPIYIAKWLKLYFRALKEYDIFHFHFGRSILLNHDLKKYGKKGKKIFFEFHGSDLRDGVKAAQINKHSPLPRVSNKKIRKRAEKICKYADGIIIHDDELIPHIPKTVKNIYLIPLRLNIDNFTPNFPKENVDRIKIVHAPTSRSIKGTKYIEEAIANLEKKYPIDFQLIENTPIEEAKKIYSNSDIIVDQIMLGTYGVLALEGMAFGKPVITYISNDMKGKLPKELPVVSANKETVEEELEKLIIDESLRIELGKRGRKYVETYHDYKKVTKELYSIYQGKSEAITGIKAFEKIKDYD